jgi:hypothetical protein
VRNRQTTASVKWLRLAVYKVIHHDDISFTVVAVVIKPRIYGAGGDPHSGYERVVKFDAQEGEVAIAG